MYYVTPCIPAQGYVDKYVSRRYGGISTVHQKNTSIIKTCTSIVHLLYPVSGDTFPNVCSSPDALHNPGNINFKILTLRVRT